VLESKAGKPRKTNHQRRDEANQQNKLKKKFSKTVTNPKTGRTKTVKYGEKGSKIGPIGSKRADAYCARSNKIKGDWRSDPNSPNRLSRAKWGCRGDKSVERE
jgi:hypothetical protein